MKKIFIIALVFVLAILCFTFRKVDKSDISPTETAVHTEKSDGAKVYSFSGSDEILTVMNGTAVIGEDEEIFSGGMLKINSDEFFKGITSYTATFYILEDGKRNTVMKNSVTDQTGEMVVFDGDDLGKISGADVINSYNSDNTEAFRNNLYFEIKVVNADGEMAWQVVKVYTMPDGQPGVKVMRIK